MITRLVLSLFICFLLVGNTIAQSCHAYYPMEEGARWVVESYDKQNEYVSQSVQTVKETATESDGTRIARMYGEVQDAEGKIMGGIDYEVKCLDGNFFISMNSFLNPEQMKAYEGMEVAIDGDFLELPSDLVAGMTLPDATIEVNIQSSGVQLMTMTIEIINRQVEKFESVTTPAGTFECVKITYTTQTKMGADIPINVSGSGAEWLAKNTGMVKSEQYDDKENLMSYSLLTVFSK